jgi:peptidoglycan-N-acetylglucosamine deacetylase
MQRRMVGRRLVAACASAGALLGMAGTADAHSIRNDPIYSISTHRKVVALSFDDGPDPRWTPIVLSALRSHHDHATFFLIGQNALAHRDLVAAELAGGDEIGNHTFDHAHLPSLSSERIVQEVNDGADAIVKAGAPRPTLFRPPLGLKDARVEAAVASAGERVVLWRLTVEKYVNHHSRRVALRRFLSKVRPGMVLLAHDGGVPNRQRTIDALVPLLDGLKQRGYEVVTVSQLEADATRR